MMEGTVRTFDERIRADVKERIVRTVESIAASAGATAAVDFGTGNNPVTYNDPALTGQMLPTLRRAAGPDRVRVGQLSMPAEDFSLYQQKIPGLFFFLGIAPEGRQAAPNHSPYFFADEAALPVGMRALTLLALDWLAQAARPTR
jgi:amidohydrolase